MKLISSFVILFLLFAGSGTATQASESISIDSSPVATSTAVGGIIAGGKIDSNQSSVDVFLTIDGNPESVSLIQVLPPYTGWKIACSGTYSAGSHTVKASVIAHSALLTSTPFSTATAVITIDTQRPHLWMSVSPNGFYLDDSDFDYIASSGFASISADATLTPSPGSPPYIQSLTATLLDYPDGNAEQLRYSVTVVPLPAPATWSFSALTKRLTILTNNVSTTPAMVTSWLPYIQYQNIANPPTVGTRRIAFQATSVSGSVSSTSFVEVKVNDGLPVVSLSGSFASVPAQGLDVTYTEGTGAQTLFPAASILNRSPLYRYTYNSVLPTNYYNPPQLYKISPSGVLSYLDTVEVLDGLTIKLENPDAGGLFDNATEFITLPIPGQGSFPVAEAPGHYFLFYGTWSGGSSPSNLPKYSMLSSIDVPSSLVARTLSMLPQQTAIQAAQNPFVYTPAKTPIDQETILELLRGMTYTNNSSNVIANGTRRKLTIQAKNTSTSKIPGGATSVGIESIITLDPLNKVPSIATTAPSATYTVNEANAFNPTSVILNGLSVADLDGNGGLEDLTLNVGSGTLQMTTAPTGGFAIVTNGGTTLTIRGSVTNNTGSLQTALNLPNNIRYSPPSGFSGTVSLKATMDDRGFSSTGNSTVRSISSAMTINVVQVNQPPIVTVPNARLTDENTDRILTGIAISDPDLPSGSLGVVQCRISAQNGALTLGNLSGITFAFTPDGEGSRLGDGTSDVDMIFRGTTDSINDALKGLSYRPSTNYYGLDFITVTINDLETINSRPAGYSVPANTTASASGGSKAWVTSSLFPVDVRFVNNSPTVSVTSLSVPIGASTLINGGTYIPSTNYPPASAKLANTYATVAPLAAGTNTIVGSNLVAQDVETKQAIGLTYTINLPVTQGELRLSRPSVSIVALVAASTFTQDDLNRGYITYVHNGALSGNDGFVFTVSDDNSTTAPPAFASGQVNGATSQQIFNLSIDRTQPIAILNGSTTPVYSEGTAPILLDNDPLTRVVNATDTTNFVLVGSTGRLTATVTIPTQLGVNPGTTSSDPQDTLTLLDQPPLGFTGQQMFYNGSPIGSYSGGNGTPLVVTLSSALPVSVAAVSETLRHLQFSNPGANLSASNRVITVTVLNGAGQASVVATKTVQVVPVNNAPVITPPTLALVTVPGLTVGGMVQSSDPDGVLSFALTGSPPTRGLVTIDALSGSFTYSPAPNPNGAGGVLTDQFEVTASDPGIPADATVKTTSQIYQVRVCDLGSVAPVFTTNPPLETVLGRVLTYAPQVSTTGLTAPNLSYSLLGLSPAVNPGLGFNSATGTITWPAGWSVSPAPTADSYQRLGLLVVDQANQVAAYQPIMLKILLVHHTSN